MSAPKTAIVERHRYVLDWFERDKIELDLEHSNYEFQYRFGPDWYLEGSRYDADSGEWRPITWDSGNSFNIANPAQALAMLGSRVTRFTCISPGMNFHAAMHKLIGQAELIRERQQVTPWQSQ